MRAASGTPRAKRPRMSRPRPIVAGSTYLVTRRTLLRHSLLRPDTAMRQLFIYLLAVCAARFGVLVHAFCVMSTHHHLVVTDTRGVLPDFLASFHRMTALAIKVLRRWEGSTWDHAQTSLVQLTTPEAIIDKIGYVLANPVASGLVRYANRWPGARSREQDLGGGRTGASRPTVYLNATNDAWPAYAELELTLPPSVAPDGAATWRDAVRASVADHETRARREVAEKGWKFLGAERAEKVSPYGRATSFEPLVSRNPSFAVGAVAGAYAAAVKALREFCAAYRAALERWRAGARDVVFPMGTWWMTRAHSAVVAT